MRFIQNFRIQVGRPRVLPIKDSTFELLSDSMWDLYPPVTETMILVWNDVPLRVSYHRDVLYVLEQFIDLLYDCCKDTLKETYLAFFTVKFHSASTIIRPSPDGKLEISSNWEPLTIDIAAKALNERNSISISPDDFVAEWRTLILQLLETWDRQGITFSTEEANEQLAKLRFIAGHSGRIGKLYAS